jgi:hypothetical protein
MASAAFLIVVRVLILSASVLIVVLCVEEAAALEFD